MVGAACLLGLTQLGLGLVIGTLPDSWSVGALRSLGIGSVLLAGGPIVIELVRPRIERLEHVDPRTIDRGRGAILAIFLLSGAAGLVYEVVWARQLVLVFGNTTQAISAILTGYFGGIAIGSVSAVGWPTASGGRSGCTGCWSSSWSWSCWLRQSCSGASMSCIGPATPVWPGRRPSSS